MSLGNGNAKSGDRGSNHNYEHRSLLSLGAIIAAVGGGATEATLQMVLSAIQNGSEFEARLVEDNLGATWLEVRTWNTASGTWNPPAYYPPGSNTPGAPALPVVYINNSSVLALIEQNTATNATETTLAALEAKLNTLGQKASAGSAPVVLSTEQQAILDGIAADLALMYTNLQLNTISTANIDTKLTSTVRVPLLQRISGAASTSVAAGKRSASFYNAGPTDATVATGVLKPGEAISFDAGSIGDTLGAIPYVTIATGDLVITTIA